MELQQDCPYCNGSGYSNQMTGKACLYCNGMGHCALVSPPTPDAYEQYAADQAEQIDRLLTAATQAIRQTLADGRAQGRQPGEWATKSAMFEHGTAMYGHAAAATSSGPYATAGTEMLLTRNRELLLGHLRHCLMRCAMALALLDGK